MELLEKDALKKIFSIIKKMWIPAIMVGLFLLVLAIFPLEYKALKIKSFLASWGMPKRIYFYLTDVAILLFLLFGYSKWKKQPQPHSASFFFLGLIGTVIISSSLNFSNYLSFPSLEFFSLCIAFSFFFMLLQLVNEQNKKMWTHLFFFAIFLVALFESFFALYQYFSQIPVWIRHGAIHSPEEILYIPGFFIEGGKRWLFDRWLMPSRDVEYLIRACGTLGHPNALGGFFLLSLPVTFYLFYQTLSTKMRVLFGLGIFVQTMALTLTFSRAAIFSWIFIALLWLFLMIRKKTLDHHLPITLRNLRNAFFHSSMKKLTLVMGISLLVATTLFLDQHLARGGILNYNELSRASDRDRKEDFAAALTMIKKHPLLGVGYGNFPKIRKELALPNKKTPSTPVHSVTLLILSETGTIGFLFIGGFALCLLWGALFRLTSPIVITLFSVLIGFSFVAQVDFYLWFSHNGRLIFFLSAAFLLIHERPFSLKAILFHKFGRKISSTV